jgi:hypothetical protein
MVMVGSDPVEVERALLAGELACASCSGVLRPWGHARWRSSRRERDTVRHQPRRSACTGCARTRVLLAESSLPRLLVVVMIGHKPARVRVFNDEAVLLGDNAAVTGDE